MVHRVVYETGPVAGTNDADDRSRFSLDRSHQRVQQVPTQNVNPLNSEANPPSIYINRTTRIDSAETDPGRSEFIKIDCAEARTSEKEKTEISAYLSDVESGFPADLKYETPRLRQIADDERLPAELRSRAARLTEIAANAR
jgi:hypothetical protein